MGGAHQPQNEETTEILILALVRMVTQAAPANWDPQPQVQDRAVRLRHEWAAPKADFAGLG